MALAPARALAEERPVLRGLAHRQVFRQVARLPALHLQLHAQQVVLRHRVGGEAAHAHERGRPQHQVGPRADDHAPGRQPGDHGLPEVAVGVVEDVGPLVHVGVPLRREDQADAGRGGGGRRGRRGRGAPAIRAPFLKQQGQRLLEEGAVAHLVRVEDGDRLVRAGRLGTHATLVDGRQGGVEVCGLAVDLARGARPPGHVPNARARQARHPLLLSRVRPVVQQPDRGGGARRQVGFRGRPHSFRDDGERLGITGDQDVDMRAGRDAARAGAGDRGERGRQAPGQAQRVQADRGRAQQLGRQDGGRPGRAQAPRRGQLGNTHGQVRARRDDERGKDSQAAKGPGGVVVVHDGVGFGELCGVDMERVEKAGRERSGGGCAGPSFPPSPTPPCLSYLGHLGPVLGRHDHLRGSRARLGGRGGGPSGGRPVPVDGGAGVVRRDAPADGGGGVEAHLSGLRKNETGSPREVLSAV